MKERDKLYLGHVLDAIEAILRYTRGGRTAFLVDDMVQSAVIRQLEIVGEAVKQLSEEVTLSEPAVPWKQIAGARDRLIHGYFRVDLQAVWVIVERDLRPCAKTSCVSFTDAGTEVLRPCSSIRSPKSGTEIRRQGWIGRARRRKPSRQISSGS